MVTISEQPKFLNEAWKDRNYNKLNDILQDFLGQCADLNNGYTKEEARMTIAQMKSEMQATIEGIEWAISQGFLLPDPTKNLHKAPHYGPSCDINHNKPYGGA